MSAPEPEPYILDLIARAWTELIACRALKARGQSDEAMEMLKQAMTSLKRIAQADPSEMSDSEKAAAREAIAEMNREIQVARLEGMTGEDIN